MQLTITAWLHPATDHATCESNYQNKLIAPRQQYEDDFGYILREQKLYIIYIWIYSSCGDGKVELLEAVDDFNKERKDVRILVWGNGQKEHCALIKYMETLLDRPNKVNHKFYYCDRCTHWFKYHIKYDNHACTHFFIPEFVCPKKNILLL